MSENKASKRDDQSATCDCDNKSQCWEPCGGLGHDIKHAVEADRQGRMPSDGEAAEFADRHGVYYDMDPHIAGKHARALLSRYGSGQPAAINIEKLRRVAETLRQEADYQHRTKHHVTVGVLNEVASWIDAAISGQPAASAEPVPDDTLGRLYAGKATTGDQMLAWQALRAAPVAQEPVATLHDIDPDKKRVTPKGQHPDNAAVDRFAFAMKEKLAQKRREGRSGWNDKTECSQDHLSLLLRSHVDKGDPVDVANFAMMLHQRGERISGRDAASPSTQARPDDELVSFGPGMPAFPSWLLDAVARITAYMDERSPDVWAIGGIQKRVDNPVVSQTQQAWQDLAAACYQAAGAYDMPERFLDALTAAANGEAFAHLIDGLLPVECPPVAKESPTSKIDYSLKAGDEVTNGYWKLTKLYVVDINWALKAAALRMGEGGNIVVWTVEGLSKVNTGKPRDVTRPDGTVRHNVDSDNLSDEDRTAAIENRTHSEVMDELVEWATQEWRDQVGDRPLENRHRRTLDDVWRQVIRHCGGDDEKLCGPTHDALVRLSNGE